MTKNKYNLHYKNISDLSNYINNSRTHSEEQIAQIMGSIDEFGFTNPVLIDSKNCIIAGHGRTLAAKRLNIKEIPCIVLDGLSDVQKRAYVIADNKLALNAGWDDELLKLELFELDFDMDFDLGMIGFSVDELDVLFDEMPDFKPATEDEQGKLDELDPIWVKCPNCGEKFDQRTS